MMFGAGLELRPMSISELMHASERARRIEVFTGVGRRRTWPADEKAAIVAESYAPREDGVRGGAPARAHPGAAVHLAPAREGLAGQEQARHAVAGVNVVI